jgi:type II secretory ATPase GspE/PulE/Tfp pilus assembly ATPase PilB-like protein
MIVSEDVRELLMRNATSGEIRAKARQEGMVSLRDDVRRYLDVGTTTIEEMLRVTKG